MSDLKNKEPKPKGGKGHTKGKKKELVIEQGEGTSMLTIKYRDGGEVPRMLQGAWNNRNQALARIESYLAMRDTKAA